MNMAERLPEMTDTDLKVLLANARRLNDSGTAKQQEQASALAPLVEAEIADRKAKIPVAEKKPRKVAVPKAKVAKPKAKAAKADVEAEPDEL